MLEKNGVLNKNQQQMLYGKWNYGKVTDLGNPLANIKYTPKVINQMQLGDYHSFPTHVDNNGASGKITTIFNDKGIPHMQVEISGAYKGKDGVFQYIIDPDGVTCNHRLFVPK